MTTRKDFLAVGASVALAPIAASASPSPPPSSKANAGGGTPIPPLAFSLAAFDASLSKPAAHRNLFASIKVDGGEVLGAILGTLIGYRATGVPLSDVSVAAVLYHGVAIALAFDDHIWQKYVIADLPENPKATPSPTQADLLSVKPHKGNPCLHASGGDNDSSIETLVSQVGARFYVCDRATRGFATYWAKAMKLDPAAVYAEVAAHLVPNAMLVPAGVWAVHAVQERHFTLLHTSL